MSYDFRWPLAWLLKIAVQNRSGAEAPPLPNIVCEQDLEGIVAKPRRAPYAAEGAWVKAKNRAYSQAENRWEMFNIKRAGS